MYVYTPVRNNAGRATTPELLPATLSASTTLPAGLSASYLYHRSTPASWPLSFSSLPYHPLRALSPQPLPPTSTSFLSPNQPPTPASTSSPFLPTFSGSSRSSPPIHIAFVSLVIVIFVPSCRTLAPSLCVFLSLLVSLLASRPISIPLFPPLGHDVRPAFGPQPSANARIPSRPQRECDNTKNFD